MVINVPDKIEYPDTAFIYITGGSNTAYVLYCMHDLSLLSKPTGLISIKTFSIDFVKCSFSVFIIGNDKSRMNLCGAVLDKCPSLLEGCFISKKYDSNTHTRTQVSA